MLTLGIETSCDETTAAVVRDGRFILSNVVLSNVVASQMDLRRRYGGIALEIALEIASEIAPRRHMEIIASVILQAIDDAYVTLENDPGEIADNAAMIAVMGNYLLERGQRDSDSPDLIAVSGCPLVGEV